MPTGSEYAAVHGHRHPPLDGRHSTCHASRVARPGDVIDNPATGERIAFRRTAAESAGEVVAFDYILPAGGAVQLAHVHPFQDERFDVVAGRARIRLGRRMLHVTPGESVLVPRGTMHRLRNDGEGELHMLVQFRPALRTEEGFEQLFGLGRDGKLSRRGFPSPLQLFVMADEYRREGRFPYVPTLLQRAVVAPVAALGRRLGYRAVDPRYAGQTPRQLAAIARVDELFRSNGIEYRLFGGWAVDFHAGRVTRDHEDVDIAIWSADRARIAALLEADGWIHAPEPDEDGGTGYERDATRLELTYLEAAADGSVEIPLRGGSARWPTAAHAPVTVELHGVSAQAVPLEALADDKSRGRDDPDDAAKDRADAAVLVDASQRR
jgi:mannose-6-phosphate isomerase-like protein (cupin superfamily)